ncbi:NAD(P)/FAD-dependent oxidoreductase [Paenibacillus sp. CC-CFT747]|nr:NAD(P)/FAD-dependent oxidoreductase [Paenibacillus sp. CC-CFT747]
MREVEVAVVGAGQAGLAAGYYLQKRKASFVILGQEERVGDSWRNRYDSLLLFTPRWYSGLPGGPLRGERNGYASKDEVADYLEGYANCWRLPVELGTQVQTMETADRTFQLSTSRGLYKAKKVIVATGPFQKPFLPEMAGGVSREVFQLHTSEYRNAEQLKNGPVLVVGAGNSGAQIAVELSQGREREVYLSAGHKLSISSQKILGLSVFWWFRRLGLLQAWIGRMVRGRGELVFDTGLSGALAEGTSC